MTVPWSLSRRSGLCPNCGTNAAFRRDSARKIWPTSSNNHESFYARGSVIESVWTCLHCERNTTQIHVVTQSPIGPVGTNMSGRTVDETSIECTTVDVWPRRTPRQLDASVPDDVRSLYEEASLCETAGAMRGAGVLYRAAVEAMAAHQEATGDNLYRRIESLRTKLGDDLTNHFHEARMVGNDSIHDGTVYAPDEIADIADLLDEACQVLYVQPAERAEMAARRLARREAARPDAPPRTHL